jgi:hypothetical protein
MSPHKIFKAIAIRIENVKPLLKIDTSLKHQNLKVCQVNSECFVGESLSSGATSIDNLHPAE